MDNPRMGLLAALAISGSVLALPTSADPGAAPPASLAPATQAPTAAANPSARTGPTSPAKPATCLQSTGTRLRLKPGQCVMAPSRVWSHRDIESTGAATTGEALRLLGVY